MESDSDFISCSLPKKAPVESQVCICKEKHLQPICSDLYDIPKVDLVHALFSDHGPRLWLTSLIECGAKQITAQHWKKSHFGLERQICGCIFESVFVSSEMQVQQKMCIQGSDMSSVTVSCHVKLPSRAWFKEGTEKRHQELARKQHTKLQQMISGQVVRFKTHPQYVSPDPAEFEVQEPAGVQGPRQFGSAEPLDRLDMINSLSGRKGVVGTWRMSDPVAKEQPNRRPKGPRQLEDADTLSISPSFATATQSLDGKRHVRFSSRSSVDGQSMRSRLSVPLPKPPQEASTPKFVPQATQKAKVLPPETPKAITVQKEIPLQFIPRSHSRQSSASTNEKRKRALPEIPLAEIPSIDAAQSHALFWLTFRLIILLILFGCFENGIHIYLIDWLASK
ncbi:hypothetical protein EDD86DRAFT_247398 [Gorgonomyces haynaldii]|nr:hypothetical protein EDD86DRAFT_247398 [Gorgonomyces haynaldii]